ncbi:hypothetical protein CLAIMM_04153 [Cladophialophora immunda]|nr:hypothetical protein CLAIMM_04153 [Cladophialophora immunda]
MNQARFEQLDWPHWREISFYGTVDHCTPSNIKNLKDIANPCWHVLEPDLRQTTISMAQHHQHVAAGHWMFTPDAPLVTINCDMGEGYGAWKMGPDEELMPLIEMANVACGFHAGDPVTMHRTIRLAKQHGVLVGAHPSMPDREGFGRRHMDMSPSDLFDQLVYQVGALVGMLKAEGMTLSHVKTHGYLWRYCEKSPDHCKAVLEAIQVFEVPALIIKNTRMEKMAAEMGMPFLAEFYPDLHYNDEGQLMSILTSGRVPLEEVRPKVEKMIKDNVVISKTTQTPLKLDFKGGRFSCCIHSDLPHRQTPVPAPQRSAKTDIGNMAKTLTVRHLTAATKQARRELIAAFQVSIRYSQAEEVGTTKYAITVPVDPGDDKSLYIFSEFTDQAALDSHVTSPPAQDVSKLFSSDPVLAAEPVTYHLTPVHDFSKPRTVEVSEPFVLFASLPCKVGQGRAVLRRWKPLMVDTEAERGSLAYSAAKDIANPDRLYALEVFVDEQAYDDCHGSSEPVQSYLRDTEALREGVDALRLKAVGGYFLK